MRRTRGLCFNLFYIFYLVSLLIKPTPFSFIVFFILGAMFKSCPNMQTIRLTQRLFFDSAMTYCDFRTSGRFRLTDWLFWNPLNLVYLTPTHQGSLYVLSADLQTQIPLHLFEDLLCVYKRRSDPKCLQLKLCCHFLGSWRWLRFSKFNDALDSFEIVEDGAPVSILLI